MMDAQQQARPQSLGQGVLHEGTGGAHVGNVDVQQFMRDSVRRSAECSTGKDA